MNNYLKLALLFWSLGVFSMSLHFIRNAGAFVLFMCLALVFMLIGFYKEEYEK